MHRFLKKLFPLTLLLCVLSCQNKTEQSTPIEKLPIKIEFTTNYGNMGVQLYNETPLHRDNFVNLIKHNAYDSLLFHRVIKNFMIQAGDPDSRKAKPTDTLGEGDAPYEIKAEFNENLFHKKGALAAAREDTPSRVSSAMQFYIVQGKVYEDSTLVKVENYMNRNMAKTYFENNKLHKPILDSLQKAIDKDNRELFKQLSDSILALAETIKEFKLYTIPDAQRDVYKTIGGTPHLDQNYTVFGELIYGLNVLDSIANVKTNDQDRPVEDVRILTARIVD
jgi:peptidyl-prolyl cis-trans isomerase B (cyclophilin B)